MNIPIVVDRMSPVPIHRQLYELLRTAIVNGQLTPGTRVPSTRQLARRLNVARTTVMAAYDRLIADGYLESRRGAWTSVARNQPGDLTTPSERDTYVDEAAPRLSHRVAALVAAAEGFGPPRRGITHNFRRPFTPAVDAFPLKEWRRLVIEHWSRSTPASLTAIDPAGDPELRNELTSYVRMTRGIRCDASQIIITTGTEQSIDVLSKVVLEPGDRVALEDPCSLGIRYLYRAYDAEIVPIPVDRDGLVVDDLHSIRGRPPVLVHVMPSHQYPTGAMLSLQRRLDLQRWAQAHRTLIVEDDYAGEFTYEGATLESLQALDSAGVVAHLGSFAKVFNASIQVGYLIVPPSLVPAVSAVHRLTARQAEVVHQRVLARFMNEGGLARYLRRLQRVHVGRRDALVQALRETFGDEVELQPSTSGFQMLVRWPGRSITKELLDRLEAAGVGVEPVRQLYQRPPADSGVVMAFASLDEDRLRSGVAVLGTVLREE